MNEFWIKSLRARFKNDGYTAIWSEPRAKSKTLNQALSTTYITPGDRFVPQCEMQDKFQNLNQQSADLVLQTYKTVLFIVFNKVFPRKQSYLWESLKVSSDMSAKKVWDPLA